MMPTSAPVSAGIPVADWLLPAPSDARIRLEEVVMRANATDARRARPLRTLGAVARRALIEEIEAKLRMVMSDTLVDLIVGGWRTYASVMQAIRKSRGQPGVDHIVPLRNHTIKAAQQNSLDIEVDGFRVMTLSSQLVVSVQLYDAVAVARDGHLVAVRSGQAKADGTVIVEGVEIGRKTLTCPLTAELALRWLRDAPGASTDQLRQTLQKSP